MPGTDPFSMVYNTVWDVLNRHKPLADLVKLRNRIRFDTDDRDPEKQEIIDSDVPELEMYPAGGDAEPFHTNTSSLASQSLVLQLTTGELRIHKVLFPVKWELLKALIQCGHNLGGLPFVRGISFSGIDETQDDDAANRGTRGWSATITITILMVFDNTRLNDLRLINE